MSDLAQKRCVPCKGGVPPLRAEALIELQRQLGGAASGWRIVDEHHLEKDYRFKNFAEALAYLNRVGEMAEQQHHHPDLFLAWGKLRVAIWTHKIDGLTESDFVFAAKCDALV